MNKTTSYGQLEKATGRLLNDDDPAIIWEALGQYWEIFTAITGLEDDLPRGELFQDTVLRGGRAISPYTAAACLKDARRTSQYIRAVHRAINAAQQRFPGEKIAILYAGCGPFAPLLLPLTTQFEPHEIAITFLDIHAVSVDYVRRLVAAFGVEDYVAGVVQGNAITYRHPAHTPLHMVVTETMQAGLAQETQVAILLNLLPQLVAGGFFLPEEVALSACLADPAVEDRDQIGQPNGHGVPRGWGSDVINRRVEIGPLLTLNRATAQKINHHKERFHLATLPMPPHPAEMTTLYLQTTIKIFDHTCLEPYACALTIPARVNWWTDVPAGTPVKFYYALGYRPGIEIQTLAMPAPKIVYSFALPEHLAEVDLGH